MNKETISNAVNEIYLVYKDNISYYDSKIIEEILFKHLLKEEDQYQIIIWDNKVFSASPMVVQTKDYKFDTTKYKKILKEEEQKKIYITDRKQTNMDKIFEFINNL